MQKLDVLRGKFITFEGGEGSGKTTCSQILTNMLIEQKISVVKTFDPGGSPEAKKIRSILLSKDSKISKLSELLLFMAARTQLESDIITPALKEGKTVICDRWFDSTIIYQGYCKKNDVSMIQQLFEMTCKHIPFKTFLMDVNPEIGLKRSYAVLNDKKLDESKFEDYGLEFHRKVQKGFLDLYHSERYNRNRLLLVDANVSLNYSMNQILEHIELLG